MKTLVSIISVVFLTAPCLVAQDESAESRPQAANDSLERPISSEGTLESTTPNESNRSHVTGKAKELAAETQAKAEEIAKEFDKSDSAGRAADGILGPIYALAKSLSFPAFHWLAFGLMAAGVVSFTLQLVLGKLVVLFKGSINVREILSDLIGLIISAVGLVLTTQAAAENSTFTHSPAAVLSSAAFGLVIGVTLYFWGQTQELQAVTGQRVSQVPKQPKPKA